MIIMYFYYNLSTNDIIMTKYNIVIITEYIITYILVQCNITLYERDPVGSKDSYDHRFLGK